MKQLLTLTACALLTITAFCQRGKDVPEFGKIDKADLEMTTCEFDQDAEAMMLFEVGELYCTISSAGVNFDIDKHVRLKILKDKGKEWADVRIRYIGYKNDESIKNLAAQTYNLDENGNIVTTKVEKKLVYQKKVNKYMNEMVFTFPDVKVGSVLEFKYTQTNTGIVNWYFQRRIPVQYSRYKIDMPREIELYASPVCMLPYERKKDSRGTRDIQVYSMKNIPALRNEPYISCDDDYRQRLEVRPLAINPPSQPRISLVKDWKKVIKDLMDHEDFGVQLKRNIPRTDDLEAALKTVTDPYQRMVLVHDYVRNNMQWNEIEGIYAQDGIRAAWKDRKGTTGEINMILVNLLKDAGLDCKPLLVSTRENGRVNTGIAETRQFNKVMAHVTINDKVYVLDATDKYTPARLIPYDVMFSEGLIINKLENYDWGWTVIWDEKQRFRDIVLLRAELNDAGVLKGEAVVNSYDYSRIKRMPLLKKSREEFKNTYFTSSMPGLQLEDFSLENEAVDSLPLVQKMNFTLPVNASGDYKYFSVNLFTGMEKNPFVADNRFSDVFFGANQLYSFVSSITIPDGYVFDALPQNIRMLMPDTSITITRIFAADKKQVSARITLEFKKPFYSIEEYPEFKEFYKKLFDLLNEQIVIRKETNP